MKELPSSRNFFPANTRLEVHSVSKFVRHVFVVDDEVMITRSLALILSREGFRVSSFTNPLEALASFESTPPDLVITDVMMPQLSGIELAIRIRRSRPECEILLLSALTIDILEKARAEGHDFRLLQKPIHPTELLHEINQFEK